LGCHQSSGIPDRGDLGFDRGVDLLGDEPLAIAEFVVTA